MSTQQTFDVAGVDGCKGGWFVVVASTKTVRARKRTSCGLEVRRFLVARDFGQVLVSTGDCALFCVDIPIGLGEVKPRECDVAARKILGRRASSVFAAPIRPCLSARDPETASRITFERTGKRLTRQSFFLLDKIRRVDELMTPELQRRVREIHPEVSFWVLNDRKLTRHSKKRLVGRQERMKLLARVFSNVEDVVVRARRLDGVVPDDILDAMVAAWTAREAFLGRVTTLPPEPELDGKGLKMEILCPSHYNLSDV
jgi:predicted RNase H-like nuclease